MSKPRSRLARFGFALGGITIILAGVLLLIMGSSELFALDLFGLTIPAETPGAIVMVVGFVVFFFSGRRTSDTGDHDPEEHLPFTRDVRDDMDSMHSDDIWDDDRDDD
ncbi:MAG: hypothetical protein GKS00_17010 [Alphaproteobacteria bacterium]|nr:hypothetical protein [Alphaproteobacteria bacterium]